MRLCMPDLAHCVTVIFRLARSPSMIAFSLTLHRSACLGLPLVAWLTSLQRQRVAAKHDVQHADECELGAAALYPCALAQVHALMQQQRQPAMTGAAFPAPYVAPRVQHMAANGVLLCRARAAGRGGGRVG